MSRQPTLERLLARAGVDRRPAAVQPSPVQLGVAALACLVGSLAVDALLVAIGTRLFPAVRGYSHFRLGDYGSLTVIGVLAACASWPIVTRITSRPRRVFQRLAVVVTLALLLPDLWILLQGEPPRAVAVLMAMHLAIALVTYNLLVRLAPAPGGARQGAPIAGRAGDGGRELVPGRQFQPGPRVLRAPLYGSEPAGRKLEPAGRAPGRGVFAAVGLLSGVEALVGLVALLAVPFSRPSGLDPVAGRLVYLVHALLGGVLVLAACWLGLACRRAERSARRAAIAGLLGLVLGASGGFLVAERPARLAGMGLMLVGAVVACTAYFLPFLTPGTALASEPSEAGTALASEPSEAGTALASQPSEAPFAEPCRSSTLEEGG